MDLIKIINELQTERQKLDMIIRSLEQLNEEGPAASGESPVRRGRRFMDAEDRLEVSRRMKKYWEGRKKGQTGRGEAGNEAAASPAKSAVSA